MSHITQYTIENKNVRIFVLNVICCGIWETCSVRFVKLFNCHRTKSNVIVLWHHQVQFTYTFIHQGIKGWCTYSFIKVNGLISVRCYCWNGTQCSHTFSEIKFNDFSGTFQKQNHIFKHYRIVIWCIVNTLLCDEIACHTPNYSTRHVENTDHRISSDGGFDDEITKSA